MSKVKTRLRILSNGRIVVGTVVNVPKDLQGVVKEGANIDPLTALRLVLANAVVVEDEGGRELGLVEFVEKLQREIDNTVLLVVMDLLKKGKKVMLSPNKKEVILVNEKAIIKPLNEYEDIEARELYSMVDNALKQGYRFLIAVIDMHGDVTYYEATKMSFQKIDRGGGIA